MVRWTLIVAVACLAFSLSRAGADDKSDKAAPGEAAVDKAEKGGEKPEKARRLRLVKPWADITTLTDEQKQKIMELHADFVDKTRELREEYEAQVNAVLSDENKAEMEANEAAAKQARKERDAQRRAEKRGGTTQPSDKE